MIPSEEFDSEVVAIDGGPNVRVTVHCRAAEETQSVILHPESWEDISET